MVRKTKEDAEITRQRIINSAREVFLARGVSKTTLEQIAAHAGVTRGAVYWHFTSKTEIFNAMREKVFLPLIDSIDDTLLDETTEDPLLSLEKFLSERIRLLDESMETRQIYEIMMIKCEYVDEFAPVLERIIGNCSSIVEKIRVAYERAQAKNLLRGTHDTATLAMDTHLFFSGLLHLWVKDVNSSLFRQQAIDLIKSHIQLRRK